MQYTRHPIAGDPVYNSHGPREVNAQLGLQRQFLHSYRIGFDHPCTGERLEFCDNLPVDLRYALDAIADRSRGRTQFGEEAFERMACAPVPSIEGVIYDLEV